MAQELALAVPHRLRSALPDLWPEEHTRGLVEMYNNGASMSEIGARYGRTRNAVAGQIRKARLKGIYGINPKKELSQFKPGRPKQSARLKIAHAPRPPRPQRVLPTPVPVEEPLKIRTRLRMVSAEAVTLLELKPHHCRWPMGDPRNSDFRFCGCTCEGTTRVPYCAEHTLQAGQHYEKLAAKAAEAAHA